MNFRSILSAEVCMTIRCAGFSFDLLKILTFFVKEQAESVPIKMICRWNSQLWIYMWNDIVHSEMVMPLILRSHIELKRIALRQARHSCPRIERLLIKILLFRWIR